MAGERRAADDYDAIAARMKELRKLDAAIQEPEPYCSNCENGGWECYGIGHNDPRFRECQSCGNPENLPRP